MVQEKVNEKMLTVSSTGQKVAGRLLEGRDLTKTEVEVFYRLSGTQLQQYMVDKDNITQSRIIDLVQDAIDMTFTSSTGQAASSDWTELRIDPTAYAGISVGPDHEDDDGVTLPELERTDDEGGNPLF